MARQRHDTPPTSSKTALAVMAVGGLLVVGLLGWALTRTVEQPAPVPPAVTESVATPPATASGEFSTAPAPTATSAVSTAFDPALGAPPQVPQGENAAVPRMAVEDLRAKMNRNEVVVIDVRDQSSYERSHIPGALHIPMASIEANLSQLPKDKPIVTYCT